MSSPGQEDSYNYIYSQLVEDPDDILGIIAYSFYKQQKIEFIRAVQQKEGRPPSAEELRLFYITSNSDASLSSYRTKAEALSREFANTVLAEQLEEMQANNDAEILRRVEALKPNFVTGVLENIVASAAFVAVIGAILFLSWSVKFGFSEAVQQVTGYQIQAPTSAAPQRTESPTKSDQRNQSAPHP